MLESPTEAEIEWQDSLKKPGGVMKLTELTNFSSGSCSVTSDSLQPHGLYSPWNSPGQNTEVSSRSLLQGIFSTQGSNPRFLHCR